MSQKGDESVVITLKTDVCKLGEAVRADPRVLLYTCIIMDMIGMMSYLLPFIGELGDFGWAPIFAFYLNFMFGSFWITGAGFLEEIVPFTDFIPTATLAWFIANYEALQPVKKLLQVKGKED